MHACDMTHPHEKLVGIQRVSNPSIEAMTHCMRDRPRRYRLRLTQIGENQKVIEFAVNGINLKSVLKSVLTSVLKSD